MTVDRLQAWFLFSFTPADDIGETAEKADVNREGTPSEMVTLWKTARAGIRQFNSMMGENIIQEKSEDLAFGRDVEPRIKTVAMVFHGSSA